MFGIGFTELVLILIAALIFIGPRRMPEIAKAAGKAFMEFRKAAEELKGQVADFGAVDDSVPGYRTPPYGDDVPEGHAPPPAPEEPPVESGDAGPGGGAAEEPRSEEAGSGDAPKKKAAPAAKKTRAKKSAPRSAASGAGKKSSKSASAGGAKKGKGKKSARARAGRDDGNDTPA